MSNYQVYVQPNMDQNWTVVFSQNQLAGYSHHRRISEKKRKIKLPLENDNPVVYINLTIKKQ